MGRGLIPGTIWKISCYNLFITYFTLTFIYCRKRSLNRQIVSSLVSKRYVDLYNLRQKVCVKSTHDVDI